MMSIKIKETDAFIAREINRCIGEHVVEVLKAAGDIIENRLRFILVDAIKQEAEYTSLLHGRLYGEFGLTDVGSKLERILNTWSKEVFITVKKNRLIIEAIYADFDEVLALSEAQQRTNKGQELEWLDWLLKQGDKTIIREYVVEPTTSGQSRTGLAIMVKQKRGKWKVPSEYAGTVSRNWVTRAIDNIPTSKIEDIIIQEVTNKW